MNERMPCPTCGCRLYKENGPCAGEDRGGVLDAIFMASLLVVFVFVCLAVVSFCQC